MNHLKDFERQKHVIEGEILIFQFYVLYYLSVSESLDTCSSLGECKQSYSFPIICHPKIYSDI